VVTLANAERRVVTLARLENDYWPRELSEPMEALAFARLFASHHLDLSGAKIAIMDALALARKTRESWLIPMPESWPEPAPEEPSPGDLSRLMVHPRPAAEWMLRMPRRRCWVPPSLRAFLETSNPTLPPTPTLPARAAGRNLVVYEAPRKRHNPKATLVDEVLGQLFPPDGKPPKDKIPNHELCDRVYAELTSRGHRHPEDYVSEATILRRAGRKK
jgi:hypothetical protein